VAAAAASAASSLAASARKHASAERSERSAGSAAGSPEPDADARIDRVGHKRKLGAPAKVEDDPFVLARDMLTDRENDLVGFFYKQQRERDATCSQLSQFGAGPSFLDYEHNRWCAELQAVRDKQSLKMGATSWHKAILDADGNPHDSFSVSWATYYSSRVAAVLSKASDAGLYVPKDMDEEVMDLGAGVSRALGDCLAFLSNCPDNFLPSCSLRSLRLHCRMWSLRRSPISPFLSYTRISVRAENTRRGPRLWRTRAKAVRRSCVLAPQRSMQAPPHSPPPHHPQQPQQASLRRHPLRQLTVTRDAAAVARAASPALM